MNALLRLRRSAIRYSISDRISSAGFFTISTRLGSERDEKQDLFVTANAAEALLRARFPKEQDVDLKETAVLHEMIESHAETFGAVKEWIKKGYTFNSDVLSAIYHRLLEHKRYTEIMKLLEGVRSEGLVKFTDMHCVWAIDAISRRRGLAKAEEFFNSLPETLTSDRVRAGLFVSAAKENELAKAEKYLEKIQVLTTDILDVMTVLYLNRDRHNKVIEVYDRMQRLGLQLSVRTCRMLLQCKDRTGALGGIEKEALRVVEMIDVEKSPAVVLNDAMEVHGYLRNQDAVDNIWKLLQGSRDVHQSSYLSAMMAFGLAGNVPKALKVFKKLLAGADESTKFERNPYALILEVYAFNGMMDKAERILQAKLQNSDSFAPYNSLIQGYMATNCEAEALSKLKEGIAAVPMKSIRIQYKTMMVLLPVYASHGDTRGAKVLMEYYKNLGDVGVYNELLKVYVACKCQAKDFKNRMQANGVEGDKETDKLLDLLDMSPAAVFKRQMQQREGV